MRFLQMLGVLVFLFSQSTFALNGVYPLRTRITPLEVGQRAANAKVLYYGGPVLANAKVYAVFWGSGVDQALQEGMGPFYSAVLNSTHMDAMKQYSTFVKAVDGRQGTNQTLGRGAYGGGYLITPSRTAKRLDDLDIRAELEEQVAKGALPRPDSNSLYMIHFPAGVSITIEGATSCQAFCAYHNGFTSTNLGDIFYGVMPAFNSGACRFGCGGSAKNFDTTTIISSHELFEAITDPFPTPGDKPSFPQAWNTSGGEEVGDLCSHGATDLKTSKGSYKIQLEWDNSIGDCGPGPFVSDN